MTKKHYEIIAACIGAALADSTNVKSTVHDVATRIALELELDNPRFNVGRFFERVEYWRMSHGGTEK